MLVIILQAYLWDFTETRRVMNLLNLLPNTLCCSPQYMIESMNSSKFQYEFNTL